jgi:hypothetical protein
MSADRVVSVSGRLILVNGLGSILGPLVGSSVMNGYEIDGVFYLMAAAAALLSAASIVDRIASPASSRSIQSYEILDPQAAPLVHDGRGP